MLEILCDAWEDCLPLPWPDDQWFHCPLSSPLNASKPRSTPKGAADLFLKFATTLVALGEWEKAEKWLAMIMKVATDSERRYAAEPAAAERAYAAMKVAEDSREWFVVKHLIRKREEGFIETAWEYWPWVWNLHAEHLRTLGKNEKALEGYQQLIKDGQIVRRDCRSLLPLCEAFLGAAKIIVADGDWKVALKLALQAQAVQKWIDEDTEWEDKPRMTREQTLAVVKHNFQRLHFDLPHDGSMQRRWKAERRKLQRILDGMEDFLSSELSSELPPAAPGQPASAIREEIRKLVKESCKSAAKRNNIEEDRPKKVGPKSENHNHLDDR